MTNRALGSSAPVDVPAIPSGELDIMTLGRVLVASGYFQDVKDEAKAVTKILFGRELGIGPIASLLNIDIIHGKPAPKPALMAAMIQRSERFGYRVREASDTACRIEFFERGTSLGIASFTMDDARAAGLAEKDTWGKFPSDMLFARAMSRGARRFCPGIFLGVVYSPEELEGVETQGSPTVDPTTGEVLEEEEEGEEAALLRTQAFVFAAARDAGIDTRDLPAMRRLASCVLGRDVAMMRTLDAADRASLGHWIRAHPEEACDLAAGPTVEPVPDDETETEDDAQRDLRLGAVERAETQPAYSGLIR